MVSDRFHITVFVFTFAQCFIRSLSHRPTFPPAHFPTGPLSHLLTFPPAHLPSHTARPLHVARASPTRPAAISACLRRRPFLRRSSLSRLPLYRRDEGLPRSCGPARCLFRPRRKPKSCRRCS